MRGCGTAHSMGLRPWTQLQIRAEAERPGTVSYTHLDVYKRQALIRLAVED